MRWFEQQGKGVCSGKRSDILLKISRGSVTASHRRNTDPPRGPVAPLVKSCLFHELREGRARKIPNKSQPIRHTEAPDTKLRYRKCEIRLPVTERERKEARVRVVSLAMLGLSSEQLKTLFFCMKVKGTTIHSFLGAVQTMWLCGQHALFGCVAYLSCSGASSSSESISKNMLSDRKYSKDTVRAGIRRPCVSCALVRMRRAGALGQVLMLSPSLGVSCLPAVLDCLL